MPFFLLLLLLFIPFIHSPYIFRSFFCCKMSSAEILWCAVFLLLLLVGCDIIFWLFLDHVKKRRQTHKKEIFICSDCWLLVFDFLTPSQLGLEIALINRRFDFYVDEHFKTRKWKLNKQLLIQWDIDGNGTKKMQIVKSDGNPLPIPQNPFPNKVIGFRGITIAYIDQNVIAFLRRFHRLFAICSIDLYTYTENVRILNFVLLNIWPMFRNYMRAIFLNSITFRRLRQLAPALLSDCPSLCGVLFDDAILPAFPPDDSANASDGQAVAKWLLMPCPDGLPKWLQCSVNSPDEQWSSTMKQFKEVIIPNCFFCMIFCPIFRLFNASSPVTFRIRFHFPSSSPIDFVLPFDLINAVTGEQLTLEIYENDFWLSRCPIAWDGRKWENVRKEMIVRTNPIDIVINDGGFGDGPFRHQSIGSSLSSSADHSAREKRRREEN